MQRGELPAAPIQQISGGYGWRDLERLAPDALVERAAIDIMTTHRAFATTGMGVVLPPLPDSAFVALADLERHLTSARPGPKVERMLQRLNATVEGWWTDEAVLHLRHASTTTAFSNFPLGLLTLPGDTSPLSCRIPIAYRPLTPLTRALQMELAVDGTVDISTGFSVLVAHCTAPDDEAGRMARAAWDEIAEIFWDNEAIEILIVEVSGPDELRACIAEHPASVLVLIAHGLYDGAPGRPALLTIRDEAVLGPGIGPLPPVVLLSACHSAPRGTGVVTVGDLLLREGAIAVLTAQVPVAVNRNATLFMRLLLYMTEVVLQRESHISLLEVWHRVQTSHAVLDIASGSANLDLWAHEGGPSSAIQEFMQVPPAGRLRRPHVYDDSEKLLIDIADRRGQGERVRNLLREHRYVPESAFYSFLGRPDCVWLRRPIAEPTLGTSVTDP